MFLYEILISDDEINKIIDNIVYASSDHIDTKAKINAGYSALPCFYKL